MKKIIALVLVTVVTLQLSSCKKEVKKEVAPVVVESKFTYSLKEAESNINFTAYKTTDKVPVKGLFKKIEITKAGEGNTVKEAVNGAEFKIPVSSIETNNSSRNFKIQKFFFDVMANTLGLTGKINITDATNGSVLFTMNEITKELPFTYTIVENTFVLNTVMDVTNWNGQAAIASLNTACKDLHKGADGVSKTWNDVAIRGVFTFKE